MPGTDGIQASDSTSVIHSSVAPELPLKCHAKIKGFSLKEQKN